MPVRTRAQEASRSGGAELHADGSRQIAVWVERNGEFMGTLALTHAVAVAGIGNRPGALQFNSGYRWPYGRREGVLPVWAHRRAATPGAKQFRRVIFQNRSSEGAASRTNGQPDYSVDDYYCLSLKDGKKSREEQLDAVTCASVFSSDKGRFLNDDDLRDGYAEPMESEQRVGSMRTLSATSLYPPRRDVARCARAGCYDHPDVAAFVDDARAVMPELDAISRATPESARRAVWNLPIPDAWPMDGEYELWVEVNVEGDYNDVWSVARFPTPRQPDKAWDSWSKDYGYPYRGQPSVVYALPFRLSSTSEPTEVVTPVGYGALEGQDGTLRPLDDTISDDPDRAPGSGAIACAAETACARAASAKRGPVLAAGAARDVGRACSGGGRRRVRECWSAIQRKAPAVRSVPPPWRPNRSMTWRSRRIRTRPRRTCGRSSRSAWGRASAVSRGTKFG